MRLQPKKQIAASLASQQKAEIDKGIAIATKVDAVRDTLSKEERNLETFRLNATKIVREEIDSLIKKKNSLTSEIEDLEEKRTVLQIPLDAEWQKVNVESARLSDWKEKIQEESFSVKQRRDEVERRETEVEREKDKATDMMHVASEKMVQADTALTTAKEDAATMRNKAQTALTIAELTRMEAEKYAKEIEVFHAYLKDREIKIENYEASLFIREQELKEGWKNLNQTAERIRNGNL